MLRNEQGTPICWRVCSSFTFSFLLLCWWSMTTAPYCLLSRCGSVCVSCAAAYVSLTLDSSAEGILVGDKRRRGGKRDARATEDSAYRSSRSRHLSPLIPVSGGFATQGAIILRPFFIACRVIMLVGPFSFRSGL